MEKMYQLSETDVTAMGILDHRTDQLQIHRGAKNIPFAVKMPTMLRLAGQRFGRVKFCPSNTI